jgi:hypothetical protein
MQPYPVKSAGCSILVCAYTRLRLAAKRGMGFYAAWALARIVNMCTAAFKL